MDEPGPSQVTPPNSQPRRTVASRISSVRRTFTTKHGLIGDYDYKFLFTPRLPFTKKAARGPPFFGLNDEMPVVLALILGFQHSLAMLAGIITPPIILSGEAGANLEPEVQQYLVSAALIVSGLLSLIQITRFHIYRTP